MKNLKFQLIALLLGMSIFISCKKSTDNVVTNTVNFENLSVGVSGYWNGSDGTGSFLCPGLTFSNNYSALYSSWEGFSYSQKADITTSGIANLYSVYDASNGSNIFAIYYPPYQGDLFAGFPTGAQNTLRSVDICNATYAALSMKNGDSFAKKFGGTTGNDKDWF